MKSLFRYVLAVTVSVISIQVQAYPFIKISASEWEEKPIFISGEITNYSSVGDRTVTRFLCFIRTW